MRRAAVRRRGRRRAADWASHPSGLVMDEGGTGGSEYHPFGMTGITGCFSPGNNVILLWFSFFSWSRVSLYLDSLRSSVASASRRILGRMNTRDSSSAGNRCAT